MYNLKCLPSHLRTIILIACFFAIFTKVSTCQDDIGIRTESLMSIPEDGMYPQFIGEGEDTKVVLTLWQWNRANLMIFDLQKQEEKVNLLDSINISMYSDISSLTAAAEIGSNSISILTKTNSNLSTKSLDYFNRSVTTFSQLENRWKVTDNLYKREKESSSKWKSRSKKLLLLAILEGVALLFVLR